MLKFPEGDTLVYASPIAKPNSNSLLGEVPLSSGLNRARAGSSELIRRMAAPGRTGAGREAGGLTGNSREVRPEASTIPLGERHSAALFPESMRTVSSFSAAGNGVRVQAKLEVGSVNDPLEREADTVADRVMRTSESRVRTEGELSQNAQKGVLRRCAACEKEKEDDEKKVARKAISGAGPRSGMEAPASVHEVLRSPGESLDGSLRSFFEPRFGYDFARVRVHTDEKAAASARSVGALAYTVGPHIVFGGNQFRAGTRAGRQLLAHELAHTVQQGGGRSTAGGGTSAEGMLQRQEDPGADSSSSAAGPPSVPYEKWSPDVEKMYRRNGLVQAANAVRRCREDGACAKVLTSDEAYEAYRAGRVKAGLGTDGAEADKAESAPSKKPPPVALGYVGPMGGAAAANKIVQDAMAKAGARAAAGAAPEAGGAAGVSAGAVAVPVALGVYLVLAIVDLVGYSKFQTALETHGYVILPHPLQVCISGCHQPAVPGMDEGPGKFKSFPRFPDMDDDLIRKWMQPDSPAPTQGTPMTPVPMAPEARRPKPGKTPAPTPTPTPPTPAGPPKPKPKSSKCTPEEQKAGHDKVEKDCKPKGGIRCKQGDTHAEILRKIAQFYRCIESRESFQRKCWVKGDPDWDGHMKQISDAYRGLQNCEAMERAMRGQGAP